MWVEHLANLGNDISEVWSLVLSLFLVEHWKYVLHDFAEVHWSLHLLLLLLLNFLFFFTIFVLNSDIFSLLVGFHSLIKLRIELLIILKGSLDSFFNLLVKRHLFLLLTLLLASTSEHDIFEHLEWAAAFLVTFHHLLEHLLAFLEHLLELLVIVGGSFC